jgi:hypothetical protein
MSTPECAWCEKTKTCFAFSQYITRHVYGQCAEWVDSMSAKKCTECSQHKTCKSCIDDFQCGWCGNTYNPTIGRCMDGDFTGKLNLVSLWDLPPTWKTLKFGKLISRPLKTLKNCFFLSESLLFSVGVLETKNLLKSF